jgi:hypothetical protein
MIRSGLNEQYMYKRLLKNRSFVFAFIFKHLFPTLVLSRSGNKGQDICLSQLQKAPLVVNLLNYQIQIKLITLFLTQYVIFSNRIHYLVHTHPFNVNLHQDYEALTLSASCFLEWTFRSSNFLNKKPKIDAKIC